MDVRRKKWMKIVAAVVACLLMAPWFAYGIAENSLMGFPRSPDPTTGHTVPYPAKGIVVYVTVAESTALWWLSYAAWGGFATILLAALVARIACRTRQNSN
jgi:hypothetical protein